ncbi:hypothetical protein V3C99_004449 [Haemonchus contortus]|nr:unnamed protein product [Haemonchus contortus]
MIFSWRFAMSAFLPFLWLAAANKRLRVYRGALSVPRSTALHRADVSVVQRKPNHNVRRSAFVFFYIG